MKTENSRFCVISERWSHKVLQSGGQERVSEKAVFDYHNTLSIGELSVNVRCPSCKASRETLENPARTDALTVAAVSNFDPFRSIFTTSHAIHLDS